MNLLNKIFLSNIILLVFTSISAWGQPTWKWVKSGSNMGDGRGNGVVVDIWGNVYVAGYFSNQINLEGTVLTSSGAEDIFLAKYSSNGTLIWAKAAGGNESDKGAGVVTDSLGNVYLAGEYSGNATFDAINITSVGKEDIFLAKYDSSGKVIWVQSAGGQYPDHIGIGRRGICIGSNNNIILTGYFADDPSSPIVYGTANFDGITLTSAGGADVFVVNYNSNGDVIWAKSGGGKYSDYGTNVFVNSFGEAYVTGFFSEPSAKFGSIKLQSEGFQDAFIVKYDKNGTEVWALSVGGQMPDYGSDIVGDMSGNVYVIGTFSDKINISTNQIISKGQQDIFIAKYSSSGNLIWSTSAGGNGTDVGNSIGIDKDKNIYITGNFENNCQFDNLMATGYGGSDIYVAKYNESGNTLWVQKAGGNNIDDPNALDIDYYGNVYITGRYNSTTSTFGDYTINASNNFDMFLAKLDLFPSVVYLTDKGENIGVYPNPSKGTIHISRIFSNAEYEIKSETGHLMKSGNFDKDNSIINVSDLPPAVYILFLRMKDSQHVFRIVKY